MAGTVTIAGSGGRSNVAGAVFLSLNVLVSALLGLAVAIAGNLVPARPLLAATVIASGAYAIYYIFRARVPFWPWPPQLPATWLDRDRVVVSAVRFGAVWGLTFATPIRAGSLVVLTSLVALGANALVGAAAFALVGFLRALPAVVVPFRRPPEERGLQAPPTPLWHRPAVGAADALVLAVVLGAATHHLALAI